MYMFYRQYNSPLNISSSNYQRWYQRFIEEYELKEIPYDDLKRKKRLGCGGFGMVYLAKSSSLGHVAIKEVRSETDEKAQKLFINELKQLSRSNHVRIIKFYGISFSYDASLPLKIIQGLREKPILGTPIQYIDLYSKCWDHEPNKRPSMSEIFEQLNFLKLDPRYDGTN
ncbi:13654_t:CDS:2 [Cetraspora pellucida]|uniref:13654_t:CDS:1 n=1 Tax=Cetraspora pellucida TaxID=1433469 RepID=A0A9N9CPR6_9GLOM|nr:13654_t:CDS:2 [Cetraspora pellucida]